MSPTVIITRTVTRSVVRKQVFQVDSLRSVMAILDTLLSERHTGPVTVYMNSGGLRGMTAEDKAEIPEY